MSLGNLGHGSSGLASGENEQASGGARRQMRPQAALGVRGRYCRAEQRFEKGAR
jgi:hypothetical protein